ncbi:conserved hypothetical protein, partial [Trichinella spiralis]|uniref:hypothetical protein n=1 Tax=Trichinella spiralis TaxID=6334 RepID=UPI0001EFEBED
QRFHVLLNSLFRVLSTFPRVLGEIYHPLWAAVSSNPTRLGAATPCTKHRSLWVLHPL